jgi:plastocyanin
MSVFTAQFRWPASRYVSVISPFVKHVNTGTLVLAMFVAVALLNTTHGKNVEPRRSAALEALKTEVVIHNFTFSPKIFTVPVGATVTWINHDRLPHVVTSADNQFQKSPVLKANSNTIEGFYSTAGGDQKNCASVAGFRRPFRFNT